MVVVWKHFTNVAYCDLVGLLKFNLFCSASSVNQVQKDNFPLGKGPCALPCWCERCEGK